MWLPAPVACPPEDSATVAVLVNSRGLTELIVLNLGLNADLISQRLFSVLALMALITTLMTAPLLSLIRARSASPSLPNSASDPDLPRRET
jgi:Kef-type K+ transport system membrane component KefB